MVRKHFPAGFCGELETLVKLQRSTDTDVSLNPRDSTESGTHRAGRPVEKTARLAADYSEPTLRRSGGTVRRRAPSPMKPSRSNS